LIDEASMGRKKKARADYEYTPTKG